MNPEAHLERLFEQVDRMISESMDINHPGIPGTDNRWFPSQGQARKIALVIATRRGSGHRIVHDASPTLGQPHYHVVDPQGRRVSGHIFYGQRPPRRAYAGRPWRESESGETEELNPWEKLVGELNSILNDRKIDNYKKARIVEDRFRNKLQPIQAEVLASELYRNEPGTLGALINHRFATCTRMCLLNILKRRMASQPLPQKSCETQCRRA